jgi:transcriptional regulator with XRE-family HTH domain
VPKRIPLSADETALKRRFGATVRRYRQRLGVSQEELAYRADMHRTYLADVERGVRNLSLSSIARLVGAIDVSLSSFFATLESLELPANGGSGRAAKKQPPAKRTAKRRS